jgi:hypothetical protein
MGGRRGRLVAVVALLGGFLTVLALTGPPVEMEVTAVIRRTGGVCLELERWSLLGWRAVGQTHTVDAMQGGDWQTPTDDPQCAVVEERVYLVRVFDQPPGVYRLCGLADDRACVLFRRVEL